MAAVNGTNVSETLNGTTANDEITGGAGNDMLLGGAGEDTAIYSGNSADYRFGWSDGYLTVTDTNPSDGDDGTDSIQKIEKIQFSDKAFTVEIDGFITPNTTTDSDQRNPSVSTLSDGGWITVWQSDSGPTTNIFAQRYDADGNRVGTETTISTSTSAHQIEPAVSALPDGGWMVVWMDLEKGIFSRRYDATGEPTSSESLISKIPYGREAPPAITTLSDGGWVVSWINREQIVSHQFDASGAFAGSKVLIGDSYMNADTLCTTALADGGWLVAWEARQDLNSTAMQRYSADGIPVGDTIYNTPQSWTAKPAITALTDGGWLTAWTGNDGKLVCQRYNAEGQKAGELIQTNLSFYSHPYSASIINLADGGWLISTGSSPIESVRFDSSGNQTAQIPATFLNKAGGANATATALPDGGWLLTWQREIAEKGWETFSLRYNADGSPQIPTIEGTDGDDTLSGQSPLTLAGGLGDDIYILNSLNAELPTIIEKNNEGIDSVYSSLSYYKLTDNIEIGRLLTTEDAARIDGNQLNNTLFANNTRQVLDGGSGIDTASFIYSNTAVTLAVGNDLQGISTDGALYDIENLTGSNFNDIFYNNTSYNTSNNIFNGESGDDTVDFSFVYNAISVDLSKTNPQNIYGTELDTFISIENILGSTYNDKLIGNSDANTLAGNAGDDILDGGAGNDTLSGWAGIDTASYASARSAVTVSLAITGVQATGGSDSDTLISIENLSGSAYNDSLTGSSANNKLSGGAGNDSLNGGAGADNMVGGDGSDTYFVDNAGDVVNETNANTSTGGSDTVNSYLSKYTLGANIENGRITAGGTASLTGNSLNNILYASTGNNVLNGSSGSDTASYLYASSAVTVSLATTVAQATGGSGSDTLTAIENLTGSNYNDKLTGNSAGNKLSGGLGNDVLNGGAGADNMIGGDGSDTYYVDHASDVVSETNANLASGGSDTVYSYLSGYNLGANVENGRILASAAANLTGNSLNNVLMAGNGNNILNGSDGIDTASYAYATSAVTVNLSSTNAQATKGSGSDTLISIENLTGSNYNDTLTGNAANNVLNGGSGNDRLTGGGGQDTLIGGAGNDIFAFTAPTDSGLEGDVWDVVKDFVRGADRIDLSKLDANTEASGDNAFTQIISSAATFSAAGQLRLTDGVLYGNTDTDADAEFAIQLIGVASVTLADFIA